MVGSGNALFISKKSLFNEGKGGIYLDAGTQPYNIDKILSNLFLKSIYTNYAT